MESRSAQRTADGGEHVFHFQYVGYFDPRDPVDSSGRPCEPKVQRPLPRDSAIRLLKSFSGELERYVEYDDKGYVVSSWSRAPVRLWEELQRYCRDLAKAEGAVVINEAPLFLIVYPLEAQQEQSRSAEKRTPDEV
jgi:hypothetical protein